jgi:hypothetical protein
MALGVKRAVPTAQRAALDAWLAEAENVLAKHGEASTSPSFVAAIAADVPFETVLRLADLEGGLAPLLERLVFDPGRWIVILEFGDREADLFAEFVVFEDGSLVVEAVSNTPLRPPHLLNEAAHEALGRLGWDSPVQALQLAVARPHPDEEAAARDQRNRLLRAGDRPTNGDPAAPVILLRPGQGAMTSIPNTSV